MKDVVNFMGRRYSAVSTSENCNESPLAQTTICEPQRKRSLQSTRNVKFSILDSFFHRRQEGKLTRTPKSVFLLMAVGLLSISTGIFMYFLQPYDSIFKWKLLFGEGGEIFELWKSPPVDLYVKIYLFNITNTEEFLAGKAKIKVEEIGPYVYKELLSHENITFNDNGTLSSTPSHPLVFQEHLSEGHSEDDIFMLPHIALLSIAQVAAEKSFFLRLPINMVIRNTNSEPIVRQTAKEFMFGYSSKLATLGNTLLPDWIYFDKVGLIDRMYDFDGDFETFFTGESDSSLSGLYDTFRGSTELPQWEGEHCTNIQNASDGTKFQSFLQDNTTLKFFRKSMCRSQRMIPIGEESQISGLSAQKYMFEENALDNGHFREENKCYCRNGNCLPRGLIDVTDCYYGFPIALSYPHFLDVDESVLEQVDGCKPNRSEHESHFMINRISGLPLSCSVKFQINMAMRDVGNMAHVEQFSNLVIPMVWFEITMAELPKSLQNRFILYLNILPALDKIGHYILLIGGVLLLIIAVSRAATTLLKSTSNNKKISKKSKYNLNIQGNGVYVPCEEKLMCGNNDNVIHINDDDEDYLDGDGGVRMQEITVIRRNSQEQTRYELDEDTALSDSDDSDSLLSDEPSSSSQEMAILKSRRVRDNGSFSSTSTSGVSSKDTTPSLLRHENPTSIDNLDEFDELRIVESCDRLDRHSVISTSTLNSDTDSDVTISLTNKI